MRDVIFLCMLPKISFQYPDGNKATLSLQETKRVRTCRVTALGRPWGKMQIQRCLFPSIRISMCIVLWNVRLLIRYIRRRFFFFFCLIRCFFTLWKNSQRPYFFSSKNWNRLLWLLRVIEEIHGFYKKFKKYRTKYKGK